MFLSYIDKRIQVFQDLDQFSLDDYAPLSNIDKSMAELLAFVKTCANSEQSTLIEKDDFYILRDPNTGANTTFCLDRDQALENEEVELLGIDHPRIERWINLYKNTSLESIGIAVQSDKLPEGVLSIWEIETHNEKGHSIRTIAKIDMDKNGQRSIPLERNVDEIFRLPASKTQGETNKLPKIEQLLEREILHRGKAKEGQSYSSKLIGWIEISEY